MKRALAALALASSAGASSPGFSSRDEVIRLVRPATVQLRWERGGGGRRAASGVVVAADVEPRRAWILTTRHFLEPIAKQDIFVIIPGRKDRVRAKVASLGSDSDLALLEAEGISLPPARLKETAKLGDDVWIVAFPWGRRMTVVGGGASRIGSDAGQARLHGPPRMDHASV